MLNPENVSEKNISIKLQRKRSRHLKLVDENSFSMNNLICLTVSDINLQYF